MTPPEGQSPFREGLDDAPQPLIYDHVSLRLPARDLLTACGEHCYPFIRSLTDLASFSISSAFLMTVIDMVSLLDLSTSSFN